ncbi:Trpm2: Transient receptor potential cation channel subfamily M member 2 [Crotalus adamanteus]|uniref:Trpm2: Transient receptor potential cation channel subfamily M member 2 n=1 Tax=Crotalus adamanteus TaxID=8729 RepID=A0AAW1BGC5_CROAD
MAGPGLRIPMEQNKIHHDEGYPLDLESYYDITMISNFRRSNSPSNRSKRRAHFSSSINEKAKLIFCTLFTPQENLRLWIPENIQKKECVYFIESSQLSDSG